MTRLGLSRPLRRRDFDVIGEHLHTQTVIFPLTGRLREVVIEDYIFIKNGLTSPWRRWLRAHAFAHILLHVGNQVIIAQTNPLLYNRQELQADLFAGYLLVGDPLRFGPDATLHDIAAWATVPEECLLRWLQAVR